MITDKLRREVDALDRFLTKRIADIDRTEKIDFGIYTAYNIVKNDWLPQIQKELTELEKELSNQKIEK